MKATETTVLNFIGGFDKVFIIPPFQRNYEWGKEQCAELFWDIVKAHINNKSHYLGNVVYFVGKNNGASYSEYILVDGQQRVTTVLLLLCALRDMITSQSTVSSVNKRYLLNDTSDHRFRVRLKQTSYDSQSFMNIIDGTPIQDENNNVVKNYREFKRLIVESKINPKELYESIPKLEIVEVNLQIEDNLETIQTVFEKINSTGKPLTPADLIRNYLLLANNSDEQERLYEDYWVNIERMVSNENITRFSRDYLVMNIFDDVPEKQIYKLFKEHFTQKGALHKDILQDMYKYSKYFAWVKFESCPNIKINRHIKVLNFLKSEDMYPLYIYLLADIYDSNISELEKIFELLADFMLRYRIVAPGGGGGSLRSVVQQLLEGLSSSIINPTYDDVLFELSNSSAPSGRYPIDDEFKNTLMESVNTNYARIALLRLEEYERKNIPVEFDKVTVEHLMPQTLSDWWVSNFGGKEEAERIYEKYINCIGNLTPISKGYNSSSSNKPWNEKVKRIQDVQFVVTSEIASNSSWKEDDLIKRNNDISTRICESTISPLVRTRKYQTKSPSSEFEPGLYPVSDISTSMNGVKPNAIIYNSNPINIKTWREYICKICELAYDIDTDLFEKIVSRNNIHKATSTKNYPDKDPIISLDTTKLVNANPIGNTDYFSEGALSAARSRVYAKRLLDIYGITDQFQVQVGGR